MSSQGKVLMLDLFGYGSMIDRRIILEGASLVQAGYQVIHITRAESLHTDERGLEIRSFGLKKKDFIPNILAFVKYHFTPDIVHAHDLPSLPLASKITKEYNAKLVYDAHEIFDAQFNADGLNPIEIQQEALLIENIDAMITVNRQCREIMLERYPSLTSDQVHILTNATVAPTHFNPRIKQKKWHQRFHLPEPTQLMVFQGGLRRSRNIDCLLQALTQVPENIHLGFITFQRDQQLFADMARDLDISHRIHFVLDLPWDEVHDWLASADVGVIPYQANCLNTKICSPNKMYEFVVAGLPMIGSSELINVKEAIDHYQIGVHSLLGETQTYVDAILEMFDPDQGGCKRFREHVIAARPHFLWEHQAPKLLSLYQNLMNPSQNHTAYTAIATKS